MPSPGKTTFPDKLDLSDGSFPLSHQPDRVKPGSNSSAAFISLDRRASRVLLDKTFFRNGAHENGCARLRWLELNANDSWVEVEMAGANDCAKATGICVEFQLGDRPADLTEQPRAGDGNYSR